MHYRERRGEERTGEERCVCHYNLTYRQEGGWSRADATILNTHRHFFMPKWQTVSTQTHRVQDLQHGLIGIKRTLREVHARPHHQSQVPKFVKATRPNRAAFVVEVWQATLSKASKLKLCGNLHVEFIPTVMVMVMVMVRVIVMVMVMDMIMVMVMVMVVVMVMVMVMVVVMAMAVVMIMVMVMVMVMFMVVMILMAMVLVILMVMVMFMLKVMVRIRVEVGV
jgi:hypothetical protein